MAAPIQDLHPDDTAARNRLAADLIQAGQDRNLTVKDVAARLYVTPAAVSQMRSSRGWNAATVQRWERAVNHRIAIGLDGLEVPDDGDTLDLVYATTRADTSADEDRLHLRVTVNNLVRIRRHLKITQAAFGAVLGVSENAVGWNEAHPDGWRVASIQRYARALGGSAVFGLAPVEAVAG